MDLIARQAIIIFARSKYDPYIGSRPSLVQETGLTVVPTSKSTLLLGRVSSHYKSCLDPLLRSGTRFEAHYYLWTTPKTKSPDARS
jgi:hypothetical protein